MPRPATVLQRYVPTWVQRLSLEDTPRDGGGSVRFEAALMIADVSGFTALGERLAESGPEGAETLWRIVNTFFGETLDLIQGHGGEVLRFAGDAPIVIWPVRQGEELDLTARRASACALALQESLGSYDTGEDATIRFRVAVAAGEVVAARLGGIDERIEPLVGGAPFHQVAEALQEAGVGEVLVSSEVAARISDASLLPRTPACSRLLALPNRPEPLQTTYPALHPRALDELRRYVSRGVLERIDAGHAGWLGELRTVTTLFMSIEGLDYGATDIGPRLDALLQSLQSAVYLYSGSVNQFLVDDKGTVLLAAWGLPGTTHEDDASRAVRASLLLHEALASHGLEGSIGVSTGRVFCGVKGNSRRAEYGLLGAPVNLAARLMQAADGGILCDYDTERAARGAIVFDPLPDILVKGRGGAVRIFEPTLTGQTQRRRAHRMVGREDEQAALEGRLDDLVQSRGGVVLIEADAGMGKSVLLENVRAAAVDRGLRVLAGAADPIEHATPYFALRPIFSSLLGIDPTADADQREVLVRQWFDDHPDLAELAPLFNPVLRLALADTETTRVMEGQARVERTRATYVDVLSRAAPVLVIVEDLHWLDSASWELVRVAMRDVPGGLFMFATRPRGDREFVALSQLLALPELLHLELGPLTAPQVVQLVCARLEVASLPDLVQSTIVERAEGHPFFSEELALALLEDGVLQVEDDRCTLSPDAGDLSGLGLPSTLEGIIATRLDLLTPIELLSLKTGAVIGRTFRRDMLSDIYPVDDQRELVPTALEAVHARNLTQIEAPEPDVVYLFQHIVTQQVAYGQLLFQQRRELHEAAARWYEMGKAGAVEPHYPLIAHHWRHAEVRDRAVSALEAAGNQAFASFAHREAIGFLTAAEELDSGGDPSPAPRRGAWARTLGLASSHLGRTADGVDHLQRAVGLLGDPVPSSTVALFAWLLVEAGRQIARRWLGPPTPITEGRDEALAAVDTYAELGLLAYYQSNVLLTLYSALRSLNLAESYGPSPELARMKAAFAHVASASQLHGAAERYSTEAVETAESFSHGVSTARAHQYRAALLIAYGRWDEVAPHADAAMASSIAIGHGRGQEEALNLEIYVAMARGDYARVERVSAEMERSATWREDAQVVFWARVHLAEARLGAGRVDDALRVLEQMDHAAQTDNIILYRYWGLRVHALIDEGSLDEAVTLAETHLLPAERATSFIEFRGFTASPALQLARWRRDGPGNGIRRAASKACASLHTFASLFLQGRAAAYFYDGHRLCLDGRRAKGVAQLERSLETSTVAGELCQQMLAHRALAELAPPARQPEHAAAASRLRGQLSDAE